MPNYIKEIKFNWKMGHYLAEGSFEFLQKSLLLGLALCLFDASHYSDSNATKKKSVWPRALVILNFYRKSLLHSRQIYLPFCLFI